MRRNSFIIAIVGILFFLSENAYSQDVKIKKPTKVELKGQLLSSSDGELLVGAYVYLGKDQNTPIAITDSLGRFSMKCFADSLTTVSFSYMGFIPLTKRYFLRKDHNAGEIKLAPELIAIDEVVVTGTPPLAVQKGDTTEFNASALKMAADADLENLLKKLPGFEIVNGKIMAQGVEVKKLYIDGKTYFLNNPSEALKNLPASLVSKVKMFDDQSEEAKFSGYDDGTKYRSLNITTKDPNKMKMFGFANGGYGISDKLSNTFKDNRYDANLSANLFDMKRRITISGGLSSNDQANTLEQAKYRGKGGVNSRNNLSVNYSSNINKNLEVTGNYTLSSSKSYDASMTKQDYFPSENYDSRIYESENHSWNDNQYHNINVQIDYNLGKRDRITFTPTLSFSNGNSKSASLSNTVENGDSLNNSVSDNQNKTNNYSLSGRLSWMHAFKKRGRTFTTTLNYSKNNNDGSRSQNVSERFLTNENQLRDTLRNNLDKTNSNRSNYDFSASYSEPLGKDLRLSANYSFESGSDENSKRSLAYSDKEFLHLIGIDTALTNELGVIDMRNRIGLNINYNKEKIRVNGGVTVSSTQMKNEYSFLETQDSTVKSNYIDFSPRAEVTYKMSKNRTLATTYHGNTSSPSATQLQDILDVSNPLQVSKGNPNLKKTFNHSLSLRYNTSNSEKLTYTSISLTLHQSFNDVASNMLFINRDTVVNGYQLQRGTRLSSPVNLNGGWSTNVTGNHSFQIKPIKMFVNTSLTYRYAHSPSIYDNSKTFNNSHNGNLGLSLSTNLSENFDFSINSNTSYSYSINTQTGESQLFNQNIGTHLRWIFWKGIFIGGQFDYSYYLNKKQDAINQSNAILNAEIGKKFGSRKQYELKFSASDILRQRNTLNYSLTDHYASTNYRTNLNNYYNLSFSYRLLRMGGKMGRGGGHGGGIVRAMGMGSGTMIL